VLLRGPLSVPNLAIKGGWRRENPQISLIHADFFISSGLRRWGELFEGGFEVYGLRKPGFLPAISSI
jgi:hypothetical protein